MSLRRNRYAILVPALLLVVALALPGCSHQVLTFFFTGVPEPGQEDTAAVTADPAAKRQERVRVRISYSFVHGPVGANRCNLCHQSRGGNVFSQPGGSALPSSRRNVSSSDPILRTEMLVVGRSVRVQANASPSDRYRHRRSIHATTWTSSSPKRKLIWARRRRSALSPACRLW